MNGKEYNQDINPNLNFLLVDDDPRIQKAIRLILKKAGFKNIHMAESGMIAVDILKDKGIDLVFLDWDMPGLNGDEVLEMMKNMGLLKHTKVLMLTAHSEKDYIVSAMQLGATSYMVKPFIPLHVYDKLKAIFKANLIIDK
jgi:DNA-binding response OmpR family regulator